MKKYNLLIVFLIFKTLVFAQDNIKIDDSKIELISDESIENTVQSRAGHKNGNIDAGERITFLIALKAFSGDFISTSANISTTNKNVKIINPKLSFDDIKQGNSIVSNKPLVLEINYKVSHREDIHLYFEIVDSQKRTKDGEYKIFTDGYNFNVNKVGPIQYSRAIIDDDNIGQSKGDGDGIIEKSDRDIEIPLLLENLGEPNINNVVVKLSSKMNNVRLLENTHNYTSVKGNSSYNSTPADYVFYIDERGPKSIDFIPMKLDIKGTYNDYVYNWEHTFKLGNIFGYLDLSHIDPSIEVKVNWEIPNKTKLKYLSGIKVDLSFSKPGFETLNKVVDIVDNKTISVKAVLKENPKPTINYLSLKEEEKQIKLTKPEDFSNRKSYQQFFKSPNFKRERKRPLNWGNLLVGVLIGGIAEVAYVELTNNGGDDIVGYSGAFVGLGVVSYGIPGLFMGRRYKPIRKNIDYNQRKKLIAINKANERSDNDFKNQLVQNSFISKKRNEQIKLENIEIENKNEVVRKENEILMKKNDSISGLNNEIIKRNNSKKAIFSYKIGEGNWIELN